MHNSECVQIHSMAGLLEQKEASTSPVIPCEVLWSSTVEMLKWYANWNYTRQNITENGEVFGRGKVKGIKKLVGDLALYQQH